MLFSQKMYQKFNQQAALYEGFGAWVKSLASGKVVAEAKELDKHVDEAETPEELKILLGKTNSLLYKCIQAKYSPSVLAHYIHSIADKIDSALGLAKRSDDKEELKQQVTAAIQLLSKTRDKIINKFENDKRYALDAAAVEELKSEGKRLAQRAMNDKMNEDDL